MAQQEQQRGMTPKQKEVFDLANQIGLDEPGLAKKVADRLGTTENNVHGHLRRLRERGHLPDKASGTNGGQRRPGRPPKTPATPPPAARISDQRPGQVPLTEIIDDLTEQTQTLLREAESSKDEIDRRMAENVKQSEELQRERDELSEAQAHLKARVEALTAATTA